MMDMDRLSGLTKMAVLLVFGLFLVAAPSAVAQTATATLYSNTFDADLGDAVATDGGAVPPNNWQFRDDCAANALTGHSDPGAARWGNPTSCDDYGDTGGFEPGDTDTLDLPTLDTSECVGGLTLEFNYLLDYARTSDFDRARVEISVDGGAAVVVADNDSDPPGTGINNLVDNDSASWTPLSLDLSADAGDSLAVTFIGETDDGFGNLGPGFLVDDVAVSCTVPLPIFAIPTLSEVGLGIMVLLLMAGAWLMMRRTRQV